MKSLKVLQSGDQHYSNKADKLSEVITTNSYLLERARIEQPNVAVLTGDVVDEHDGPIRIDSEAARAAIRFVTDLADICPVVIVRGTRSHDRETPYLFRHLRTTHQVHVATNIEQIAMLPNNQFVTLGEDSQYSIDEYKAVFTLFPSPDKSNLIAAFGGESLTSTTMLAKEALNDVLGYIGEINNQIPENVPRILAAHGMITGAEYSSGSTATGEDFEYCLSDLALTNTDLKAFGHVHKYQKFPGNVFYSGSPGRLNMGETEIKGFLIHDFNGRTLENSQFIETPARRFVLYDVPWIDVETIMEQAAACESECSGADVRFRYTIPEECRQQVSRDDLTSRFLAAGARQVKIEWTLIPKIRQRAAGISRMELFSDKVIKWGETTGIAIPQRVLDIAATIEGRDIEELIADARRAITGLGTQAVEMPGITADMQIIDILPTVDRRGFLRRSGVCLNRFGGFLIQREV